MNSLRHNATLHASRVALCCSLALILHCETFLAQNISPEARKHFAAGRQAQDANQFDEAAEQYTATIRLAPTFAGAYANLGLIDFVQGNFKDSADALAKGLRLDPTLVGASLYLGIDYLKLNLPGKALPCIQHAVQLDPSNKDAQSWLGTAYWQAGHTWDALTQLRKANRKFPNDPDIIFVLGEAYRKAADQEMQAVITQASGTAYVHQVFGDIYLDQHVLAKAAGHYQRAYEIDPNAPLIHFELGEVALFAGHLNQAQSEYHKQLGVTPSAAAKARLAELGLLNAQIPSALELFSQAITLSPLETVSTLQLPPSFANVSQTFSGTMLDQLRSALPALQQAADTPARNLAFATVYARIGRFDAFQTAFTLFEATIPRQPAAPNLRDRALQDFQRQSFDKAEAEIHTYLETHPQDLQAQYLAAQCHRLLSLSVLKQLLNSFPDSYRSHQLLAQTYEQRDEDDKAVAEYKKVEELSPGLPGIHFALGHLFVEEGDFQQAVTQLKEELRLDPNQPEANAEMGMALLSQDQSGQAIQYLTRAIALQPDLWTAHEQLGKAFYLGKNYDGARRELTLALHDDPEGVAHYQLGMVYKALGQTQAAKREFDASRKIKSDRLAAIKIEMPDAHTGASNE